MTKLQKGVLEVMETEKTNDEASASEADATKDGVGDVEMAGETTAAVAISGPTDTRPVGAETLVRVADTPHPAEHDDD